MSTGYSYLLVQIFCLLLLVVVVGGGGGGGGVVAVVVVVVVCLFVSCLYHIFLTLVIRHLKQHLNV